MNWITVAGIRSTGLTAALGIAALCAKLYGGTSASCRRNCRLPSSTPVPNLSEDRIRPYQRGDEIVCHCELVTKGEIETACTGATACGRSRRPEAPHPRHDGALPGLLLFGPHHRNDEGAFQWKAVRSSSSVAGPAGLGAAQRLHELGVKDVLVIEREAEAGGIPRHCGHTGFGWNSHRRMWTGPRFANEIRSAASPVEIRTRTTVLELARKAAFACRPPWACVRCRARQVLLATGTRETPRSARLVGGTRPQHGVMNTGSPAAACLSLRQQAL